MHAVNTIAIQRWQKLKMEFNVKARTIFYENCCLRNNFVHRGFNLKERKKTNLRFFSRNFIKWFIFMRMLTIFFNLNVIFVRFNNFSGMKVPLFFRLTCKIRKTRAFTEWMTTFFQSIELFSHIPGIQMTLQNIK